MGRRNECKRRDNDLAGEVECTNRNFERNRRVAHRDAIANAKHPRETLLKFPLKRAAVREVTPVEHRLDALKESLPVSNVGTTNVNCFREDRSRPQNGEDRPVLRSGFRSVMPAFNRGIHPMPR